MNDQLRSRVLQSRKCVLYFSTVLVTTILFAVFVQAYVPSSLAVFLVYLVLGLLLFSIFLSALPEPSVAIRKGRYFQGPAALSHDQAWPRTELLEETLNDVLPRTGKLTVLSGASGAGKTTFVNQQLYPHMQGRGCCTLQLSDYSDLDGALRAALTSLTDPLTGESLSQPMDLDHRIGVLTFTESDLLGDGAESVRLMITFDQAEQLIYCDNNELTRFNDILKRLVSMERVRCLMVVRQDFYYRLRFLGDLLPAPHCVREIPGFGITAGSPAYQEIVSRLLRIADEDLSRQLLNDLTREGQALLSGNRAGTVERVPQIMPVQIQVAGLMLETQGPRSTKRTLREYKGVDALFRSYWESLIKASPIDSELTMAIFYALSTRDLMKRPLSVAELSAVTFLSEFKVRRVLDTFSSDEIGLIKKLHVSDRGEYVFEWTHDILAATFREYSGLLMDAALRDNIAYLVERVQNRDREDWLSVVYNPLDIGGRLKFARVLLFSLGITMLLGIFLNEYLTRWTQATFSIDTSNEPPYILPAMALLPWAVHVYRYTVRYFMRIRKEFCRFPWWGVATFGLVINIIVAFLPSLWIVALGLCGILLGVRHWLTSFQIGRKSKEGNGVAHEGMIFAGASTVYLIVGIAYSVSIHHVDWIWKGWPYVLVITPPLVAMYILMAWTISKQYATRSRMNAILGFMERAHYSATDMESAQAHGVHVSGEGNIVISSSPGATVTQAR